MRMRMRMGCGASRTVALALVLGMALGGAAFAQTSMPDNVFSYRPPITGKSFMVESNQPLATMAGYKVLEQGGNAIDAAVAVAAALSVSEPYLSNIFGGDAFVIIYLAKEKKVVVVNASGWAPTGATVDYYMGKGGMVGGIDSFEIPGAFSGWMKALNRYGSKTPAQVFAPAIELCEKGIEVTPFFNMMVDGSYKIFNKEAADVFCKDGKPMPIGSILYQANLAKTFRDVAAAGKDAEKVFYAKYGKKIVDFSKSLGGLHTLADFTEYSAEFVEPLSTNYKGYDVYACPPGCQGMALIQSLNILEGFDVKAMGLNSAAYINVLAEAMNLAFADRDKYIGDPRFVKIPIKGLTSKAYAVEQRKRITLGATEKSAKGGVSKPEQFGDGMNGNAGNTTFFSVVDKDRNVVACTTSILNGFGCGLIAGDTGILLNNRMQYFWLDPDHPNVVAPRKRTFQTITPSIALKDGKPFMAFGTPGADVQEQTKLQIFFNVVHFGMNPQQAIEAPRFRTDAFPTASYPHDTYPGMLRIESRIPQAVTKELSGMGYDVKMFPPWTSGMGGAGMIVIDPATGFLIGGVDPRREGYVIGW